MRISVKRLGGYTGFEDSAELDTNEIDETTASEVEQLVHSAQFFDLSKTPWPEDIGADLVRYEIAVLGDQRGNTVAFADDGSPDKATLRTLAERIMAIGRQQ